jgi:DNA-binding PadR family transcriptional regulator
MKRSKNEPVRIPSLSPKEAVILRLLLDGGEMYGLEIVSESGGEIPRGTVYVTLGRMEDKGFIESWADPQPTATGGLPRRRYRVTGLGANVLEAQERAALFLAGSGVLA